MEFGSSHDLLVWLVDVWESSPSRAGKLARGDWLIELAVAEGKIPEGPIGLMDGIGQWCEDLRTAGWVTYDDSTAVQVRFPGTLSRSRNDVVLSRNFVVTPAGVASVKSSLTAASVGRVAGDLAGLVGQFERRIDTSDAPEETKDEARHWLTRVGSTAVSDGAAELLVRAALAVGRGLH